MFRHSTAAEGFTGSLQLVLHQIHEIVEIVPALEHVVADDAAEQVGLGHRAGQDDLFCIFGSAGFLEIAAQDSSAAKILDARRGQPILLSLDRGN